MTIEETKSSYRIEEVIGQSISLKPKGTEMVGTCPFHNDEHASLSISPRKQIYKCFACGATGDMINFFTAQGHSTREAINIITSGSVIAIPVHAPTEADYEWENLIPESLPNPLTFQHNDYDTLPVAAWPYHDAAGNVISYACRFELPDGTKDVLPCTFSQRRYRSGATSGLGWNWRKHSKPHPLYNLHELVNRPNDIVLVVEGEKAADAGKRLFPNFVVISWLGGKDNVKYADWSPLAGRNVYLWGDNDLPGVLAMFGGWEKNEKTQIYRRFKGVCECVDANFTRVNNSPDFPKKWDIADATWTPNEALAYLNENISDIPTVSEHAPNELPPVAEPEAPAPEPAIPILTAHESAEPSNPYFRCLGFENNDTNLYVFFVYRANTIVKMPATGISTSNILQLAPLNYWEGNYPKHSKSAGVKFDINNVADHLISSCIDRGIFNPEKIRGRGAWLDMGVPVIHCGDTLIVSGVVVPFIKHKSKFIYEARQEMGFELTERLPVLQANKLIQLLERLNWSRDINARLLAGWIVIAPICGALTWRPHTWLTGASGSGKSWVLNNIIKKMLGDIAVSAQSSTTEAGIRQYLKSDARPVIIDEVESENKQGDERVKNLLDLVRACSSDGTGGIIKGQSNGSASEYRLKSCFALCSIGVNITQRSDASRITVLELKTDTRDDKKQRWQETQDIYHATVTESYIRGFQSRSVLMMPTIIENAKVFSNAAASVLEEQRAGDQLGVLLAGAYSLYSDGVISYEDAKKWILERDWSEEKLQESTRDEIKVLHKIMDAEINIEIGSGFKRERTIGKLIMIAQGTEKDNMDPDILDWKVASEGLKRAGIISENGCVVISDNSRFIKTLFKDDGAVKNNYHIALSRINGAVKVDGVTFGSNIKGRGTRISIKEIFS